jgi:hypothetical protein
MAALLLAALCVLSVSAKISGPWYYIADGLTGSHAYNPVPSWLDNGGNTISLAFMNPADLTGSGDPVPAVFKTATTHFKDLGKQVYYNIGGWGYQSNWGWLSDAAQSRAAGVKCGNIANQYGVGIEIDYEGGDNPHTGVVAFIQGFRSVCGMGKCLLTMDLYGSPGGADWQKDVVPAVLPSSGVPGQTFGDGNWLDFVNVMVIDGQTVSTDKQFWQQWLDSGVLNAARSTFGLIAGWPGLGFCSGDTASKQMIDDALSFLSPKGIFGILAWAVCPNSSCGDWTSSCDANAPGFNYLCTRLGSC